MKEENKSRARGYKIINRVFEKRNVQSFCRKATFEQRFELNVGGWMVHLEEGKTRNNTRNSEEFMSSIEGKTFLVF